jgi:hypothetical protein
VGECLVFDRGQAAEAALAAKRPLDLGDDRQPALVPGGRARWSRTFFCSSAKKDPIAALSPQAPTRPIEPTSPLLASVRTKAFEQN